MDTKPLISVCIPSYNHESFIAATLESVLKQSYENLEVIVMDDQSTDDTVSVVRRVADPRIVLIENKTNLGLAENWNKALSNAKGKYIKMMGADDLIYPDCISRQVEALESPSNTGAVLAVCNTDVVNAEGDIVLRRRFRFRDGRVSGRQLIRSCVRWGANLIGEPVVGLFRRDALKKSGQYDASNPYMIDLVFWAELLKHGDAIMDCDRLAAFRISPGSVSTSLGFKQATYTRRFIQRMRDDRFYCAGWPDAWCGYFFAFPRCILRNLLINLRAGTKGGT